MAQRLTVEILGLAPVSVNAMYRSIGHGIIMSERGKKYKNALTTALLNNKQTKLIDGDVAVEIHFEFADKRKRDIDNFAKGALDCAKTLLFNDDSDILCLTMTKKIGMSQNKIVFIVSPILPASST